LIREQFSNEMKKKILDTMNEKYNADIVIESKWIDNTDIKKYDPNVDWNPHLFIENLISTIKETITYNLRRENGYNIITETRKTKGKYN
jgi:hypothetical protein